MDCTVTPLLGRKPGLMMEILALDRHLRISRDELVLAQHQANRELIRGLAHEIKNPLGGIRGAAQLLEREYPDNEHQEYTRVIIREADRLQNLVDRMLGPNRLPQKSMVNVHEMLEHVRQLIEAEADAGVTVIRDYDPSIPALLADREQLIQATLNVGRNALQARATGVPGGDGVIVMRTRMPPAHHQRTPPPPGGLAEHRGQRPRHPARHDGQDLLSDGHHPRLRHRPGPAHRPVPDPQPPRPDRVPVAAGAHGVLPAAAAGGRAVNGATALKATEHPISVWVVDDDESIRWVLEKSLQRERMRVQSFPGSAELLDALQEDVPDVLICDIRMPGVDGLELMERVRAGHPQLPVIIVTAHSDLDGGEASTYQVVPSDLAQAAGRLGRWACTLAPPRHPQA